VAFGQGQYKLVGVEGLHRQYCDGWGISTALRRVMRLTHMGDESAGFRFSALKRIILLHCSILVLAFAWDYPILRTMLHCNIFYE
jgi:hypothetical protein